MAVPKRPDIPELPVLTAAAAPTRHASMAASGQIFKKYRPSNPQTDRNQIAKAWQVEAYRQVNICGEARYAATLFAAIASRAEIGVSESTALVRKAVWVKSGPEVDAFSEIAPTVRERSTLIRNYMLHRIIAGECYLIARERVESDPGYIDPPEGYDNWDDALRAQLSEADVLDPDFDPAELVSGNPNVENPIWEIVAVTELQKVGTTWRVRHQNGNWLDLKSDDPVIRFWVPDPENRLEAWSPYRSLLPTLKEIEWLTAHIFRQVRSRLMSAGVWFLPDNLTFPPPPADAVEGGVEAIAAMNEAEQFMLSLAASGMQELDQDEVSFPSVVMADPLSLANIDQKKLIQFWSEIDDKAMVLRSDAVRRFALGMDLPPEQVLGSSGLAVTGAGGSAGSVNHWGVWANEEQTISGHIEPAMDDLVATLTSAFLRTAVPDTDKVIGYDTATLRLRQDRSKEALEWYDRGILKADVALRETGFDPENDMMTDEEHKVWVLNKIVSGSATPEQLQAAFLLLTGSELPVQQAIPAGTPVQPGDPRDGDGDGYIEESGPSKAAPKLPGGANPSTKDHPYEGPPRVDHEHHEAPFNTHVASAEALVLRALEKAGNRLLNDGKRGRDKDRSTPPHMAHLNASIQRTVTAGEFDFGMLDILMPDLSAAERSKMLRTLGGFCAKLYNSNEGYTRQALIQELGDL